MSQITSILDSIFKTNGGTTRQWRNANEILLTHTEEAKKYVAYMKNKIRDLNKNTQLLALDFLDYSIDDGKIPLWTQVGSKEFLSSLVNIYKTRNDTEVQTKILYLIQKWANKFQKYNTIIPNFTSFYENLKNNDVEFPEEMESTYEKYLQGGQGDNSVANNKFSNKEINSDNKNYIKRINVDLRTSSYERKYKRLVNKLDDWTQQIQDANVFMDMADENGFDDELRGICNDLEAGKNQLVDTIESGKLKDEKLMQISLNVQDDIEMTLERWNDVKNGRKPKSFVSSFFKNGSDNNEGFRKNNINNNGNNQNNKGGFDLLGFDDDLGGNNNNYTGNNNLGNDLFDVFSGNNNNNNNMNQNNFNNNQNNDFFNNMGNNQNNNQNLFGNNSNNNFNQNNKNNNNQNFFGNDNMNNNFFGNNNNNVNQNQNQQNQNTGNNDLFSQIFNNNNNTNNNNFNNLQNNLNSVYNESSQFGVNLMNNMPNNTSQNNANNNYNNIMAFNNNFNFNDNNNNQNNKNTSNKDFVFNF